MIIGVGILGGEEEGYFYKFLDKAGASSVFNCITITKFVNQNLLFSFSSSLSTSV